MANSTYVGISCTGHENALAIVDADGEIVFAEATERPLQRKRAINVPADAHQLRQVAAKHLDGDGPIVTALTWSGAAQGRIADDVERMRLALRGCWSETDRQWISRVRFQLGIWDAFIGPNRQLAGLTIAGHCERTGRRLIRRAYDHHLTHAAYAAYTSGFDDATVAVFDGYGEGQSYAYYHYSDGVLEELQYEPTTQNVYGSLSSLGLFYGLTICSLFGFEIVNGEEWKVMGLAPYGHLDEELLAILRRHIHVDGLDLVVDEGSRAAYAELQRYARAPHQPFEEVANVAHTAQRHFTDLLFEILERLASLGRSENLVLGGGCALNSSFNGELTERGLFSAVYIPPAPSDDGNAIGAALLAHQQDHPDRPVPVGFHTPYLGSAVDQEKLRAYIGNTSLLGQVDLPTEEVIQYIAQALVDGAIIGWMQGRAEFGPRALGNRSILADPRRPDAKDRINAAVKFREGFRPFAPAVLAEHGDAWFENYTPTPYMERTLRFRPGQGEKVPAVCHVDGTGRLQTVDRNVNPRFHTLLSEFLCLTNVPIVLNTSLNVMGRPIANSVTDALEIYLTSGLDLLVVEDVVLRKAEGHQP